MSLPNVIIKHGYYKKHKFWAKSVANTSTGLRRHKNEDRLFSFLLGEATFVHVVIDGHGGSGCADYVRQHFATELSRVCATPVEATNAGYLAEAMQKILTKIDVNWIGTFPGDKSGACVCAVAICPECLVTAHCGDSRALVFYRNPQDGSLGSSLLTELHDPSNPSEVARIREAQGVISRNRVFGYLAVTRAIGDNIYKVTAEELLSGKFPKAYPSNPMESRPVVTGVPQVQLVPRTPADAYLLVSSDGLFDLLSNAQIAEILAQNSDEPAIALCDAAAKVDNGMSHDDISVIVVKLN